MKAYKTELKLTKEQKAKLNQTFGNCRYVYNAYIAYNQKVYEETGKFVSGFDYSKLINNDPNTPVWLKSTSSKATQRAIMNAETAYKRFFKKKSEFPRFKKKGRNDSAYFIESLKAERHRIFIPTLKWLRLKEKGYIPVNAIVSSATISRTADKYYVSVLVKEEPAKATHVLKNEGIGIDLGLKEFAYTSFGAIYKNINKSERVRKLEKKLKREQRSLSRKYENKKKRGEKSDTYKGANIAKNILRVNKLYARLTNIRTEYIRSIANELVKAKPAYIVIEDLNIKGMMKNKHLSKAIAGQKFYEFKTYLLNQCKKYGIELREVSRWFPSSKMCSRCGKVKDKLSLNERTFECECGLKIDRDFNASINLRNAAEYKVLT